MIGSSKGKCALSGTISSRGSLIGRVSVAVREEHEVYAESYEAVPDVLEDQILHTANKILSRDIVVKKIPYQETSNEKDGITVYIGTEV